MDLFPLYNSIRIAIISAVFTFALGIWLAWLVTGLPRVIKGILDCVFTLPLVLPPTVIGFFLLKFIGIYGPLGKLIYSVWGEKVTMTWYASVFAVVIVTFPLMYRTVRSSFEAFDKNIIYAGKTLGLSNAFIFFRIILPCCKEGLVAGIILSFARGLGEYGATSMVSGYTPGRTATISTTVYQLWREGNDALAYKWVFVNIAISFAVLLVLNLFEKRAEKGRLHRWN